MANKLDIVVFGATGYTGKYVLKQVHRLAKDLTWGVAGRNHKKLGDVLTETAKHLGVNDFSNVRAIVADVENEESIKNMTAQAKVIINCCGPYTIYGEIVVKSCIETGTHYVDVTGEPYFVGEVFRKYGEIAEQKGVYIVNACGYGSLAADMGICFMEDNFPGTVNSVQIFRHSYEEGGSTPGPALNYGTWASLVHSLGNKLKIDRSFTHNKLPILKPKLTKKFLQKVDEGWAFPFPSLDDDSVHRSQQFFYEHNNKRPVQMVNYAVIPKISTNIITAVFLLLSFILGQFKFGRDLLLKYPEFFSNGLCARITTNDKVERTHFSLLLKCRGWSDKLSEGQDQYRTSPNKEIIGRINGMNPGYGFTSVAVTLCALMILTESKNLPSKGGVYSPAAAFSKTSLVQELQANGTIFEVSPVNDL